MTDHPSNIHTWRKHGHTLHIESWEPRSPLAIIPAWHQGFVDGLRVAEGDNYVIVKRHTSDEAERRPVYTPEQLGKAPQRSSPTHTAHRAQRKESPNGSS